MTRAGVRQLIGRAAVAVDMEYASGPARSAEAPVAVVSRAARAAQTNILDPSDPFFAWLLTGLGLAHALGTCYI
jgi:hypothetical protein